MLKRPQHIKRKCTKEEFESIEVGDRTNDMRIANFDINVGDFITYVEVDEDSKPTGRETLKKITNVINTKDLYPHVAEIEKYGFAILSFQPPEANTLRSVLTDHFSMACVIKKIDEEWSIIGGPQYWPLLICPDLIESNILDNLKINLWPDGVYSVHIKIEPELDESTKNLPVVQLSIEDTFVLVCTANYVTPENAAPNSELNKEIICVDVDVAALLLGKAISVFGDPVTPAHPEEVEEYYLQDSAVDKINDGMFSIMPEMNMDDEEFSEFLEEETGMITNGDEEFDEEEMRFLKEGDDHDV